MKLFSVPCRGRSETGSRFALCVARKRRHAPCRVVLAAVASLLLSLTGRAQEASSPAAGNPSGLVELQTLSGRFEAPPARLAFDAETDTLTLGPSHTALESVLSLRFPGQGPGAAVAPMLLVLDSGEELHAEPLDGTEDEVAVRAVGLRPSAGDAPLRIPIERVRAVVFPGRFPSRDAFEAFKRSLPGHRRRPILPEASASIDPEALRPAPDAPPTGTAPAPGDDKDYLWTSEGSRLGGILGRIGASGVVFEADRVGELELPYDRVQALVIAALDDSGKTGATDGVSVHAHLRDGSLLRGDLLAIEPDIVRLRSRSLGDIDLLRELTALIEIEGGRVTQLSDLEPTEASSKDVFAPRPVQRDANVRGGPLRLRGQSFRRGLGMRSHTRLAYGLNGAYTRFQATLGIDDDATRTTIESRRRGGGTAVFRVMVDGRVVFQKELSYRDAPLPIDLAIDGAQTLDLEVDYGPGLWMQDFADWADAKLIKKE